LKDFSSESSKEFYAKLYYNRWATASPNQTTGMIKAIIGFCNCFNNTKNEMDELNFLILDPISYVVKKNSAFFTEKAKKRLNNKISLAKLDWLYFRDTHLMTKLNKSYSVSTKRTRFDQNILFEDILDLVNLIHLHADEIFNKVRESNSFNLNFDVDAYKSKIMQVGGDENGFK